jgi:hypothetical protein
MRYQVEPDFAPGQVVLQCDPLTVATTVTFALVASRVLIVDVVDVLVRMLTPEHAGTIVVEVGEGLVEAVDVRTGPPSAKRQAK